MISCKSLIAGAGFCFYSGFACFGAGIDTVKVEGGLISGVENAAGDVHIFKGIPFAAPPVGALRWKAPQPPKAWKGVRVCNSFGASPMQNKPAPFSMWSEEFLIPKEPISEDCLFLNVWTGSTHPRERRPVLVWIYGGGFVSGGAAVPIYDGEAMAKMGIVFVSFNYRVGIFGFFSHPALTKESGKSASGNYGLMDQLAALKWVRRNISAFGGDPANVTIAGQSAGSMSVNALVASPLGKGLFEKAIGESGASFTNGNATLSAAEEDGQKLMETLQVSTLRELRAMPAEDLMKKAPGIRGPIIDGYVLPDTIRNIFLQGKENKVDLLTGWNEDEGLLFGAPKKAVDFQDDARSRYGADATTLLHYYPAGSDSEAAISQLRISRDQIFGVQNYTWANIMSAQGMKVYVYRFVRKPPATGEYVKYGAFHTAEVPYAFDNLAFVRRPWESSDHELAKTMSAYWANFAKNGDPNENGLPAWDGYLAGNRSDGRVKMIMVLKANPVSEPMADTASLDFLYGKMLEK
jgi:para-nitrobenzyl esterase